jgi:hypothetical protein
MRSTIRAVVESSSNGVLQPKRRRRPSLCNHLPCSHQSRMPGGPSYSILIKSTSISRLSSSLPNTSRETPTRTCLPPRVSSHKASIIIITTKLSPQPRQSVYRWKRLCKSSGWQVECEPNSPGANVDNPVRCATHGLTCPCAPLAQPMFASLMIYP